MPEPIDESGLRARFERDGFVLLPGCFPEADMERLSGVIAAHYGSAPPLSHTDEFLDLSKTQVIPWFPQHEGCTAFDAIAREPRLRQATSVLLGKGWHDQYCMVMFSRRGTVGQAWHQDCPPEGEHYNLNRLVYADSIIEEVGGEVVVLPGSHRLGTLTAGDPHADLDGQVTLRPRRGDLLLLHGHCWHRVGATPGGHRHSVNFRAATAGAPDTLTDVCVYRNMRYRFSTAEVLERR